MDGSILTTVTHLPAFTIQSALTLAAQGQSQSQAAGCFEDAARSGEVSQPLSAQASATYMTAQSSHVPSSAPSSLARVQAASHHARPASMVRLYAAFLACRSLIWSALDGPRTGASNLGTSNFSIALRRCAGLLC